MSLIIDGHNLIGVMPGIDLGDRDDELRLLTILRAYRARVGGQPMIVFFDSGDMPASLRNLSTPGVQVHFSGAGQTADDAIVSYLQARAQPGQYAVVTNDQGLSWRVRDVGASVVRSSDFVPKLIQTRSTSAAAAVDEPTPDPRDPAFLDIYQGFIETERVKVRFGAAAQPKDITSWLERLYGDDLEQAQRAALWLGRYGGAQALGPLRDALTHVDVRVRTAALLAMGDLGDLAVLPDLCDRLAHDAGAMAREAAAQSLGRIGDRRVEAVLHTATKSDAKNKVRKAAQAALDQVRARRGLDRKIKAE